MKYKIKRGNIGYRIKIFTAMLDEKNRWTTSINSRDGRRIVTLSIYGEGFGSFPGTYLMSVATEWENPYSVIEYGSWFVFCKEIL